jgi:hypothetical protein
MTTTRDPAQARYLALALMRVLAALMIVGGMVLAFGERTWFDAETDKIAGYALMALGFFDLLVLMPILIRRWKSGE